MYGLMATSVLYGVAGACLTYFSSVESALDAVLAAIATFSFTYFIFAWIHEDRRERRLRRSYWFDVGVVSLSTLFVPIYLVRSRPGIGKLKALLGFGATAIVALILCVVPLVLGFLILGFVFGLPTN